MGGVSKRDFLIRTALVGGALVVGACDKRGEGRAREETRAFGPFIRIGADGAVTVVSKHSELGQGAHTGLAVIVAEELDADLERVRVEAARADRGLYGHTAMGIQITGSSTSIANSWLQLRKAGATARQMLLSAAAQGWNVPPVEVSVRRSVVFHQATGRSAGFGELVRAAAAIPPPADPPLKPAERFTLVGTEGITRLDAWPKSTGAAVYTQDLDLPGQLTAVVAHPPRFGARMRTFDAAEARKVHGVIDVIPIPSGVAVLATGTWSAIQGRQALKVEWDYTGAEMRSSEEILADYRALADAPDPPWKSFENRGDVETAFARPGEVASFAYNFPFLAHAPMEPMNCVAQVDGRRVRLTFGAQTQTVDQINVAALVGGKPEDVEIVTLLAGGSFGRRSAGCSDFQKECVSIAQKVGGFRPVKLVWTREDDMAGGYYRPAAHHRISVKLDAEGYPAAWRHRLVSPSLLAGTPLQAVLGEGPDRTVVEGVLGSPYLAATPAVDARVAHPSTVVPVSWLRSVGATHTAMAMEHTIDQLARRAGIDPAAYRRVLYRKAGATRRLRALDLAVAKSGWGEPPAAGWTRGIAVHESFGSVVVNVAEVKLEDGQPRTGRVVVAVDCGLAVTPDIVRAQMEGGVCYGLSYDLYGRLALKDGVVETTNFDSYRVLRMNEAPHVETFIVPSGDPPSGVGEPGTPVIGPAVANALLAITGKPTAVLPLVKT